MRTRKTPKDKVPAYTMKLSDDEKKTEFIAANQDSTKQVSRMPIKIFFNCEVPISCLRQGNNGPFVVIFAQEKLNIQCN